MSRSRISIAVSALLAVSHLAGRAIAYVVEIALTPVILFCRYLFSRDFRHSISQPKLVIYRVIAALKPVYRESYWTDGLSLRAKPLRC